MKTKALSLEGLEYQIYTLRTRMITIGNLKGLTHPETIKLSQELDILLNQHRKVTPK
jgi:stage 0 sporulation regulatory protein